MAIFRFEIKQLVEHILPLFVVVPFHFVTDLPFETNAFETAQTLFRQTSVGDAGLSNKLRIFLDQFLRFFIWICFGAFEFRVFVTLCFYPFTEFEVRLVPRRDQAVAVLLFVLE